MNQDFKDYSNRILKNLNGEYQFDLKSVLKTGWKNMLSQYGLLFKMLLSVFAIGVVLAAVYLKFAGITVQNEMNLQQLSVLELIVKIMLAPLFAGLMMQGAKAHVGQGGKVADLFSYLPKAIPILVVTLLISVLSMVGFSLYILPGIYVVITTGFAVMLVADGRCKPISALVLSIKMVNKYLPQFLMLYAVFLVLLILTSFTFGIGLIVLMPYYYCVKGMLYCNLFGFGSDNDTESAESTASGESTFEA